METFIIIIIIFFIRVFSFWGEFLQLGDFILFSNNEKIHKKL